MAEVEQPAVEQVERANTDNPPPLAAATMSQSLNLAPISTFDSEVCDESGPAVGALWEKWVKRFEIYVTAMGLTGEAHDGQKRAVLLHSLGPKTLDKFDTLPNSTTYAEAKA